MAKGIALVVFSELVLSKLLSFKKCYIAVAEETF